MLAQALLAQPRMFNHNRGLWGYTGTAADGEPLSIQSTGMGGPSAAIVISELVDLGARTLIRVGTCGALDSSLELGQLLIAGEAIPADGTSSALGAAERVTGDPGLLESIEAAGPDFPVGTVISTDLFYDDQRKELEWLRAGAMAVEMETATLYALAAKRGARAASVLIASDLILPERRRIGEEELRASERRLGELAALALAEDATSAKAG